MKLIKKIYFKFLLLLGSLKKKLNIALKYKIKNFEILLTGDHALPIYKAQYSYYDLYLPNLVKYLKNNSSFIDIGCNCGDTFFNCYEENLKIKYYCVDAEIEFINLFKKNIIKNKNKLNLDKIHITNYLIGNKLSGFLKGSKGSKKLVKNKNSYSLKSTSLNDYVNLYNIENISLLKIDTDGYDYNIINSGDKIILKNKPLIFFECYVPSKKQKINYLKILDNLNLYGYDTFCVFDNYGKILTKNCNKDHVSNLINYLYNNEKHQNYGSIIYFDILAFLKKKHQILVDRSLKIYKN